MNVRKSQTFLLILFIFGVIVIGATIAILSQPLGITYDATYNDSAVSEDIYQQFFTQSKTIWLWAPIFLIIPLVLWIFQKINEEALP